MKVLSWLESFISRPAIMIAWLWAKWVFRVVNQIKFYGLHLLPRFKNVLIVCNHQTLIDSWLVGAAVVRFFDIIFRPWRIPWNAPAQENFYGSFWKKILFTFLRIVPVKRGQGNRNIEQWFDEVGKKMQTGCLLVFFEGTRTRNGDIGEAKGGVAELIYRYRPTVVPIYIENINSIMPVKPDSRFRLRDVFNLKLFKRGRLVIGEPIKFNGLLDQAKTPQLKKLIGNEVRQAVINLQKIPVD